MHCSYIFLFSDREQTLKKKKKTGKNNSIKINRSRIHNRLNRTPFNKRKRDRMQIFKEILFFWQRALQKNNKKTTTTTNKQTNKHTTYLLPFGFFQLTGLCARD